MDLVECPHYIYAARESAAEKRWSEVIYAKNRVLIKRGDTVNCSVVSAGPPVAGIPGDYARRREPRIAGGSHVAQFQHVAQLCIRSPEPVSS